MKIFSGVPPCRRDGAGDFLLYLAKIKKIKVIWKPTGINRVVKELIICLKNQDWEIIGIILNSLIRYIEYEIRSKFNNVRIKGICLFHFQSIGVRYTDKMIRSGDVRGIFLVDNFYFCGKGYNWRLQKSI